MLLEVHVQGHDWKTVRSVRRMVTRELTEADLGVEKASLPTSVWKPARGARGGLTLVHAPASSVLRAIWVT